MRALLIAGGCLLVAGCGLVGGGGDLSASYQFQPANDTLTFSVTSKACGVVASGEANANKGVVGCVVATDGSAVIGNLSKP